MAKEWGPCTWYLFHTLVEKINEEHFNTMKMEIINIIKRICNNLPCPDCSQHSTQKLSSLNVKSINSKEDLKKVLLSFHNFVNSRTNKPEWNETQLNDKYSLAKTSLVVQYFIQIWQKPNPNPRLMTHNFHKDRVIIDFINWWKNHHSKFNQ